MDYGHYTILPSYCTHKITTKFFISVDTHLELVQQNR